MNWTPITIHQYRGRTIVGRDVPARSTVSINGRGRWTLYDASGCARQEFPDVCAACAFLNAREAELAS
jgi:hypothetical protein